MKRLFRWRTLLALAAVLVVTPFSGVAVFSQTGEPAKPPAATGKAPVQGYTRTNRKTGLPEQVKPYKRRLPPPKPVQVQSYTRGGKPVEGHQRRPPSKPSDNQGTAGAKKP